MSEVGSVKELHDHIIHIQGKPLELARFLDSIEIDGDKPDQHALAKYLRNEGYEISQPQIHRLLSLLTLPHEMRKLIESGELAYSTAYLFSRLNEEKQAKVKALAEGQRGRITQDLIRLVKMDSLGSPELFGIMMKAKDLPAYDTTSIAPESKAKTPYERSVDLSQELFNLLTKNAPPDHWTINEAYSLMESIEESKDELGGMQWAKGED